MRGLQIPRADIIQNRIAEYIFKHIALRDIFRILPNNNRKFRFVVQPLHNVEMPVNFLSVRNGTVHPLGKINRHRAFSAKSFVVEPRGFLRVRVIIDAQTNHVLSGKRNRRKQLYIAEWDPFHQFFVAVQLFQLFRRGAA